MVRAFTLWRPPACEQTLVRKISRARAHTCPLHVRGGGVERAVQLWTATSGVSRDLDKVTTRGDR